MSGRNTSASYVLRKRDALLERWASWFNQALSQDDLPSFVEAARDCLKIGNELALTDSVKHLVGNLLKPEIIRTTAWRLAANVDRLNEGFPSLPWSGQAEPEWVCVQVLSLDNLKGLDCEFSLRVITGSPASMGFRKCWKLPFCHLLSTRLGYNKRRKRVFSHPSELVRLRFEVLLTPETCRRGLGFRQIRVPSGCKNWNRYIIGLRFRRLGKRTVDCPFSYTHPCFRCHVGYDVCPAATHKETRGTTDVSVPQASG